MFGFPRSDTQPNGSRRHRHHHPHGHGRHGQGRPPLPPEVTEIAPEPVAPDHIRLFTCVARHCCQGKEGKALLAALRQAATDSGAAMDVKACGCLDQCENGPVVIAHRGSAARGQRPPKGALSRLFRRPVGHFTQVQPEDADRIVQTLLTTQRTK